MSNPQKILVEFIVEQEELEAAATLFEQEEGKPCPDWTAAFARDLQAFAYDDGGMHGEFLVLSVEPASVPQKD
jgi:hypothetical protein